MANVLRLADMLFNRPLLSTETLASSVAAYLNARMTGKVDTNLAVNFDKPTGRHYLRVSEGTAVLPIMGGLTHRSTGMEALCSNGLSSYASIMREFDEALADDTVERIVLHVDSGGGEATGCFDLANHIHANRGKKQIIAYVDGMSASAAYALTSAADEVIASPNADVGSIGVIMIHEDWSKMLAKQGVEATIIKAGANKGMGSPYTPLSKEAKETMQARIDDLYDSFTGLIAQNRPMTQDDAKATEASVYNAKDALSLGLIDKIMTPDEFAAYITPSKTSAKVAQKPVVAKAEESNQETEMTNEQLQELNELRAFKAKAEQDASAKAHADAVAAMQPKADAIGFDANMAVTTMSTMSADQKNLFMSVIDNASSKLSASATDLAALKEAHAAELASVQATAQAAVEASAALSETGASGDASVDEQAEKNATAAEQARAAALAKELGLVTE